MKKVVIICALITITYGLCAAQGVSIMLHTGVGTFAMKKQKDLQQEVRGSTMPWRPVHKFPPYWIYGGSLSIQLNSQFGVSAYAEYGSTGGTLNYTDYSGSVQFDQLLRYMQGGIGMFLQINLSDKWPLFATSHLLVGKTKETVSSTLRLGNSTEHESIQLHALNFSFRPGLMMQHRVKTFLFQANLGMEIQLPGKLQNEDGNSLVLQNREEVNAQWSGLRATLGVGLLLGKNKKAED